MEQRVCSSSAEVIVGRPSGNIVLSSTMMRSLGVWSIETLWSARAVSGPAPDTRNSISARRLP
jgi:hypothetical protein